MKYELNRALSGSVSGFVTQTILHPIDTVKTNIQAGRRIKINGLYRGIVPNVIDSTFGSFIFFYNYEAIQSFLNKKIKHKKKNVLIPPLASALSSFVEITLTTPLQVIKNRRQIGISNKLAMTTNLFNGYTTNLLQMLPDNIINFSTFEILKKQRLNYNKNLNLSKFDSIALGGVSGAVSCICCHPLDVLKTKLMSNPNKVQYYKVMKQIMKEGHLYKGFCPRLAYNVMFTSMAFLILEETSKKIEEIHRLSKINLNIKSISKPCMLQL